MKFKVLVEYEYPIEHKLPVKAEIVLHGDRVVTDNIKWIEQEPKSEWEQDHEILKAYSDGVNEVLDNIRAEIESLERFEIRGEKTPLINGDNVLHIIDKYKEEMG